MSQAGIVNVIDNNPTIPIYFEADTGFAVALFNVIKILGAGGITTSATSNIITIDGSGVVPNFTLTGDTGGPLTPTADNWNIFGGSTAAGSTPVQVNGAVSTLTVNVQKSQAIAATDATKVGLAAFNSAQFSVDANGFVSISGGATVVSFNVDASTAPGTDPVLPDGFGVVTITGGQVAAGTTANVIQTNSLAANTYTIQIQRSSAQAATTIGANGVSHFDSAAFDVDANGFVQLNGGGIAATAFDVQANTAPGTDPVLPSASGVVTVNGAAVANHSVVLETRSRAANAYNIEVQYATSAAATDATKSGVAHFDSAKFTVDANGFVSVSGTGIGQTITGDSGGALSPTAGNWNILGASTAAGTSPVSTSGAASTLTVNVQKTQAIAATDATKVGLAAFDSAAFDVDANGFVQLNGGGIAATSFTVQANTAPGTNPVVPTAAGAVTVNGTAVANHSVVLETRSRAANAYNLEIQYATTSAASDATKSGVAHFDSTDFTVDANGFVALAGAGAGQTITGNSGGALTPTGGNWNIYGSSVAAGTTPVASSGSGSTLTLNVQRAQAIAAADSTKVGLANFDSARFTVDSNGFVSLSGTGVGQTITGDSGGALSPTGGNWNIVGSGSTTTSGSGSTLTVQLTGLTNHALLVGAGTTTITKLALGTAGQILQSGGASADPAWSTATYPSTAGSAGNAIVSDGTNFNSSPIASMVYGDGSDGAQTFDGAAVILGLTPSSSVYTLARDIYLASSTINNGVTIKTNGYRIFCNGTLTNNGTIQWNGNAASGATAGAALTNTSSSINVLTGASAPGTAGATGGTGVGPNGSATSATRTNYGGQGGSGGAGVSAGGSGGSKSTNNVSYGTIRGFPYCMMGCTIDGNETTHTTQGGTGGGAGGGDGTNTGGGGGGGAGMVIVAAFLFAGTGTIQAKGGAGGNSSAGNTGGGGGGGGGYIVVVSRSVSGGAITGQTIDVSGGAQGTKTGTGVNGNQGNTGTSILLNC